MAEILIVEESIDSALKRFKKAVGREGILKDAKQRHFNGAMTRSQRRREKKMMAKSRYQKNHRGWSPCSFWGEFSTVAFSN